MNDDEIQILLNVIAEQNETIKRYKAELKSFDVWKRVLCDLIEEGIVSFEEVDKRFDQELNK